MVLQECGLALVLEGRAALDDGLSVREEIALVDQGDELLVRVRVRGRVRVRVKVRLGIHQPRQRTSARRVGSY